MREGSSDRTMVDGDVAYATVTTLAGIAITCDGPAAKGAGGEVSG
jgi:hypothetical protein